jgi:hypothetical protein
MFLKAAAFRNDLVALGFTDNGGAIHSAERILNILGQHLKYPELRHTNNYKKYHTAEFSVAALKAHKRGEEVLIEHVSPIRDFTRKAIKILDNVTNDNIQIEKLKDFIKKHYRLVLLTPLHISYTKKGRGYLIGGWCCEGLSERVCHSPSRASAIGRAKW